MPASATPPATLREFEKALRDLGYSRAQAIAIARDGFKAGHPATDESENGRLAELAAQLRRTAALLIR